MHMLCWSGIHHLICPFYQSELIFCQDLLLYCGPEILCFPCVESPTYPSPSLNKQISLFCWFRNSLCWPVLVKPTGKPLSLPGDHSGGAPGPQPAGLMRGLTAGQSESERKYSPLNPPPDSSGCCLPWSVVASPRRSVLGSPVRAGLALKIVKIDKDLPVQDIVQCPVHHTGWGSSAGNFQYLWGVSRLQAAVLQLPLVSDHNILFT